MSDEPLYVRTLPSGYQHIRWSAECWAQIPPSFVGEDIPDEYIFHASGNRDGVNRWWRARNVESQREEKR